GARLVERDGARVAIAYGDLPTNDVLHALYTDGGAQIAILLKPEGTFSLRSRKGVDVCHRLAQDYGGGGHPNAAGGTLRLGPLELPVYWARRGRVPKADRLVAAALDEADAAAHDTR
ncbi:MAG TPA: hypothetical protein VI997_05380, partial [Candidatus Thermoplasmatota archaeon]|nr:hypothetical protein [Candidatus Thermoplasmatota archaeon]